MGKVEQRQAQILEILSETGKIEVASLAKRSGVSLPTVRKDLTSLQERGLLKREQGYAVIVKADDMRRRLAINHSVKRRLAKEAAGLIKDGETVMIESGSCCILLAEEIGRSRHNVTIVTNSVFMADYVGRNSNVRLILLGGDYQTDSQALVGPLTKQGAALFHVKKLFAGTDGYLSQSGFTGDDHLRADTIRGMAENAEQVILLSESVKFQRQGVVPLFGFCETSMLITDAGIPAEIRAELMDHGVAVKIAAKTEQ